MKKILLITLLLAWSTQGVRTEETRFDWEDKTTQEPGYEPGEFVSARELGERLATLVVVVFVVRHCEIFLTKGRVKL